MSNFPSIQDVKKRLQSSDAYRRSQHLLLQEELTFKSVEEEKTQKDVIKIRS